jgi:hypothetical protein
MHIVNHLPSQDPEEAMDCPHLNCPPLEVQLMFWTASEAIRLAHDHGEGRASASEFADALFAYLRAQAAFLAACRDDPLKDDAA